MARIITLGHSNVAPEAFFDTLEKAGGTMLVDVRSKPQSRFVPWSNKARLQGLCEERDIEYRFYGDRAGGLGTPGPETVEALEEILQFAVKGHVPVLMCSEGKFRECHRHWWLTGYYYDTYDESLQLEHAMAKDGSVEPVTEKMFQRMPQGFIVPEWY